MKALIQHLLSNNMEEILEKSLLDCHCKGLHSIMLLESPGKTIRLYVADNNHELHKNDLEGIMSNQMTIGFHAHHCNITLQCASGKLVNDEIVHSEYGRYIFDRFIFKSAIKEEKGGFIKDGQSTFRSGRMTLITKGDSIHLPADFIHTVFVEQNKSAAWFVFEGKEDDDYIPYCYSTADLSVNNFDGLYRKPTTGDISYLLKLAELI